MFFAILPDNCHFLAVDWMTTDVIAYFHTVFCRNSPDKREIFFLSFSFCKSFSKANADIFCRVVVIHISVALAAKGQIKPAMLGKKGQHMIQKTAAGLNVAFPLAVQATG